MVEQAPAWLWLKAPYVGGEAPELVHLMGVPAGVFDRRVDLRPVADDARVSHQSGRVAGAEAGDRLGLESAKRGAKVLPLAQNGQPAEPRHEAFEAELLEQPPIVKHRPAPLSVVISAVEVVGIAPPAPWHAIGPDADAGRRCDLLDQRFELCLQVALHVLAIGGGPLLLLAILGDGS